MSNAAGPRPPFPPTGFPAQPPQRRSSRGRRLAGIFGILAALAAGAYFVAAVVYIWVAGPSTADNPLFPWYGTAEESHEEAPLPIDLPPEPITPPLSFEGFNPANIISNEKFFDSDAYDLSQIEGFIAKWNKGCRTGIDGALCLGEFREDSPSFDADQYCPDGFVGEQSDSAASIIYKSARSCGINPQVLLTTLQKEQGLITASGHRLNETRYTIAMGYACPDSSRCDPDYFGFSTQVYYAARQMRVYEQNPHMFMTAAERQDFIPYAPGRECGGSEVFVENLATSNLYNYTPYQPDDAALAGSPGPCSSVGNLNFYAYFNAWFGTAEKAAESAGE